MLYGSLDPTDRRIGAKAPGADMRSIRWVTDPGCSQCEGDGFYSADVVIAASASRVYDGEVSTERAERRFVCDCIQPAIDPHEKLADVGARLRTALESARINRGALELLANELENYAQQKPE